MLALCGTAQAYVPDQFTSAARQHATSYWGGQPPCGVPRVEVRPFTGAEREAFHDGSVGGFAVPASCLIVIPSDQPWQSRWGMFCIVVVHEYGHLHGYDHDSEREVMSSPWSAPERWPDGCRQVATPRSLPRVRRIVRLTLGMKIFHAHAR